MNYRSPADRLQAPPCITVTGRTSGTRKRLITLSACVESLQALKWHEFEQWICQCQLNKRCVITHQLLRALQWSVLRDAHEVLLPRSQHRPVGLLVVVTTYRLLKSPHFTENVGLFPFLFRSSTFFSL